MQIHLTTGVRGSVEIITTVIQIQILVQRAGKVDRKNTTRVSNKAVDPVYGALKAGIN